MTDEEAKELMLILFNKLNGDRLLIDTEDQLDEFFSKVLADYRERKKALALDVPSLRMLLGLL